jgi:hypothetical protein
MSIARIFRQRFRVTKDVCCRDVVGSTKISSLKYHLIHSPKRGLCKLACSALGVFWQTYDATVLAGGHDGDLSMNHELHSQRHIQHLYPQRNFHPPEVLAIINMRT